MIRLYGTSPSGKPRVLDISRMGETKAELGVSLWIHPPDSNEGWQIDFKRDQIVDAIDFLLNSEW